MRNEEERDKKIFETVMGQRRPVFLLTDDLRHQFRYFKDRRNDCAHGKSNEIGAPQVETFWLFLRSSLPKFVVGGSEEALVQEIRNHFDPDMTPPGEPVNELVDGKADAGADLAAARLDGRGSST